MTAKSKKKPARKPKKKFTDKQEQFCLEYIVDLNGTNAAIRANYSKKTARQAAARLLSDVNIQARISELMAQREKRVQATADRVIEELENIAFSDITEYVELGEKGITIKRFRNLPKHVRSVISEVSQHDTQYGTLIKFKLYDKVKSLELLGKHFAMWTDNLNVNANVKFSNLDEKLSKLTREELVAIAYSNRN